MINLQYGCTRNKWSSRFDYNYTCILHLMMALHADPGRSGYEGRLSNRERRWVLYAWNYALFHLFDKMLKRSYCGCQWSQVTNNAVFVVSTCIVPSCICASWITAHSKRWVWLWRWDSYVKQINTVNARQDNICACVCLQHLTSR